MSDAIRPFTISVSDDEIADLRDRLARTRWADPEPSTIGARASRSHTQELCAYWAESYDWRRFEAELNAYDHLLTEIDGVDIHAMHIRSPHEDATPMVLTHGWPGSVAEFMGVIDLLTNPTAHGGSADDAFHLVIPSCPATAGAGSRPRPGRAWAGSRRHGTRSWSASGTTPTSPRAATGVAP